MLSENQMNLSDSCSSSSYSSRSNNSSRLSSPNFHFTAHRMTQIGVIRSNFQMKLEATTNDDGMGCRSPLQQYPGGSSPPTYSSHGTRTVREFEEQMSNLRKENFNLKLRLYFIEETIPSYHPRQQHNQNHQQGNEGGSSVDSCGHENILKQLIDTKVEREVLRKELQEKQEILKEAAQAMTQMENIQKDTETRYDEMIEELQHKIQQLEMDRDKDNAMNPTKLNSAVMSDIMGHSDISGNGTSINAIQKIRELEGLLKQSEIKLVELQSENIKLEDTLNKRNETISEYEEKVKELVFKNSELLETIESKDKEIVTAERSMRNIRLTNDDLKVDNENLIAALRETQEKFQKEVTNSQTFEHQVREQQDTLNRMQSEKLFWDLQQHKVTLADKLCLIDELEEKLKAKDIIEQEARQTINELMKKIEEHQQGQQQQQQQEKKKYELEQLQERAAKNCQNISAPVLSVAHDESVDLHSLSDSEVLRQQLDSQTHNEKTKYEMIIRKQENTIKELKMEIKKKTGNLQNLVNKELWEKNREIERLTKIISKENTMKEKTTTSFSNGSIEELQQQQSFSDVEYTKAMERNKLLQRRVDVLLRRLDNERSNEMIIIQLRLELQKANERVEQAEKWCRDCVDVCGGLTKRLEQLAGFLNALLKHKDILHNLAADRRHAIRNAVNCSLDLSKSLNTTLSISGVSGVSTNDESCLPELSNLSILLNEYDEANDFSQLNDQEDKAIPMPIIESLQAENNALKKELDKRRCVENKRDRRSLPLTLLEQNRDSESEAWSEPDRNVSMARIGLEANKANNVREIMSTILTNNNNQQHIETDSEQSDQRSIINRLQNKVNRNLVSTTAIQERCQELEAMIALRNERILEIQCQLFDAEINLKEDKQHMEQFTKEIEQLQHDNTELEQKLNEISNVHSADSLLIKTMEQAIEEKDKMIQELNKEVLKINEQFQRDVEEIKLKHELNINNIKQELEMLWSQRLETQKSEYNESLKHNWIAREEYEQLQEQWKKLQSQHKETQNNIECLEENERELKQTLLESELRARQLQKTINETTLQSSKIIMERTKALQENLLLEKEMKNLKQQLEKYAAENKQLQEHIKQLENEVKTTTVISPTKATAEKATQIMVDDECISSQSGYNTSEELLTQKHATVTTTTTTTLTARSGAGVLERLHNSSPDLGIESDAGRISSIEMANNSVQFNRLKIVELKSNDNNFLLSHKKEFLKGKENNENIPPSSTLSSKGAVVKTTAVVSVAAATTTTTSPTNATSSTKMHDCVKVEQENTELRLKLVRTARTLEMTYEKLRVDNQRKVQIEKEIRNQINKTYNVLKSARNHIEKEFK